MSAATDTKVKDALDHVRVAAQELHAAINDAAAKSGGAAKADLEAFAQKAKSVWVSIKLSVGAQNEPVKKHLTEAVTHLQATQKHVAEGLKSSGQAVETSIRNAAAEARATVEKVSEAIAAKRSAASSAASTKKPK